MISYAHIISLIALFPRWCTSKSIIIIVEFFFFFCVCDFHSALRSSSTVVLEVHAVPAEAPRAITFVSLCVDNKGLSVSSSPSPALVKYFPLEKESEK